MRDAMWTHRKVNTINVLLALAAGFALGVWMPCALGKDLRICHARDAIPRDANGEILRSSTVRAAFQREHPCPANGATRGACPGWEVDHVIPLACGGCDAVWNMQWLPIEIKRLHPQAKDRWERRMCVGWR